MKHLISLFPALFLFAYCAIQTWRDVRGGSFLMAVWGGVLTVLGVLMLLRLHVI